MNVSHIIETALMLLVAYLIGCIIGYTLRRLTARPIPMQGEAVQSAVLTPAPAAPPSPSRELSAAARLAMASPPEPAAAPPALPTVTQQTASVPTQSLPVEPAPPISAPKLEPAASIAKPKPSSIKPVEPAAAPVTARPRPVAKVPAEPKATVIERAAPAAKAPTKSKKTAPAEPVETLPPAQTPVSATIIEPAPSKVPAKPARKPAAKASPKKPVDPKPVGLSAPRSGGADDLKLIKGIGPKIEQTLNGLGIFHFDQLSKLNKANVEWLDKHLGFKGRVTREAWLDQAKALAKPKK